MTRRRGSRRRTASIATIVGGALAVFLLNFFGLSTNSPSEREAQSVSDQKINDKVQAEKPETSSPSGPIQDLQMPGRSAAFDYYLLALSLAPAFCELESDKRQCKSAVPAGTDAERPLTLHGLWPNNLNRKHPEFCGTPNAKTRFDLNPQALGLKDLDYWMPGVQDGLLEYQWRKHGSCSGQEPKEFFQAALFWNERVNRALAPALQLGRKTSPAELRKQADAHFEPENGIALSAAISLRCKRLKKPKGVAASERDNEPHLVEVHVCLGKDANNAVSGLQECAALDQIDQGCGRRFWMDAR